MGKIVLLLVILFLAGVVTWLLKNDVKKNDVYNNKKLKDKLGIEQRIREIRFEILKAEAASMRGVEEAENDLAFHKSELKETEELLKKFN